MKPSDDLNGLALDPLFFGEKPSHAVIQLDRCMVANIIGFKDLNTGGRGAFWHFKCDSLVGFGEVEQGDSHVFYRISCSGRSHPRYVVVSLHELRKKYLIIR